jgi:hypothetical protein
MTHQILKSLLPTEEDVNAFQRLCNVQIEEMRAHDVQMKMVAKDPENYHPYPAPTAHPDIMASITVDGDDYDVDFEIVDDQPPPTLEQKKRELAAKLFGEVLARREEIIPERKRKLMEMEGYKIMEIKEGDRSKEQVDQLANFQKTSQSLGELEYYHARMEAKIDDLTEQTVAGWEPEALPESAQ